MGATTMALITDVRNWVLCFVKLPCRFLLQKNRETSWSSWITFLLPDSFFISSFFLVRKILGSEGIISLNYQLWTRYVFLCVCVCECVCHFPFCVWEADSSFDKSQTKSFSCFFPFDGRAGQPFYRRISKNVPTLFESAWVRSFLLPDPRIDALSKDINAFYRPRSRTYLKMTPSFSGKEIDSHEITCKYIGDRRGVSVVRTWKTE